MKTTVLASCTPEEEAMLAERRRLGQDHLDEIWQGEYLDVEVAAIAGAVDW